MKKLTSVLLLLVIILSTSACSTDNTNTTNLTTLQTSIVSTLSPSTTVTAIPTAVPLATATATATPTSSPNPTPATVKSTVTPAPVSTQKPIQTQAVEKPTKDVKTVKIISASSPAPRNSTATLKAKVAPGTTASIVVHYKSGPSTAAGLEPKKADSNGNVSWSWRVGGNTTLGKWRITVSSDGSSEETTFEVVH